MKRFLMALLLCSVLPLSQGAVGEPIAVGADDTMEKILTAQKGKRVSVKVGTSEELTGTVKAVTPQVVHLSELAGKEFFDAVVATKSITAVIVRTK
jgi:hypothetical protein